MLPTAPQPSTLLIARFCRLEYLATTGGHQAVWSIAAISCWWAMFWGRFLVQRQLLDLDFIMPLRLETAEAQFVEMSLLTRLGWPLAQAMDDSGALRPCLRGLLQGEI